jgi:DeoR/GlpR family transcriptional regulator of sugar metabolism
MQVSEVMVEERRRWLLEVVRHQGRVLALDAARHFGVSEDTIRRDLRMLAAEGLVLRVRGGALPAQPERRPFPAREKLDQPAVVALAEAVAKDISDLGTIILDNGVTSLRIAERLRSDTTSTVITSSPGVAAAVVARGPRLLLLGGIVDPEVGGSVDADAVGRLSTIRADVAVLGACAVHPDIGVSTNNPSEVAFKRALVNAGSEVIVAASAERLAAAAPYVVAEPSQITRLFVERLVAEDVTRRFDVAGVVVERV